MRKAEKERKVSELWERYAELMGERRELEEKVKEVKREEEAVKEAIVAIVPEGGEIGGVRHEVQRRVSVRYAEVYERIVEELVAKSKAGDAERIRGECTSEGVRHVVKGVEV